MRKEVIVCIVLLLSLSPVYAAIQVTGFPPENSSQTQTSLPPQSSNDTNATETGSIPLMNASIESNSSFSPEVVSQPEPEPTLAGQNNPDPIVVQEEMSVEDEDEPEVIVREDSPVQQKLFFVSLLLNVLLLIGVGVLYQTQSKAPPAPALSPELLPLRKYLKYALLKGDNLNDIKLDLLREGFSSQQIVDALNEIFGEKKDHE